MDSKRYTVIWRAEVEAPTPHIAAMIARTAQTHPQNIATVYEVTEQEGEQTAYLVDLSVPMGESVEMH